MKIVINKCFGGFSISKKCAEYMSELGSEQAKAELEEYNRLQNDVLKYRTEGTYPDGASKSEKMTIKLYAESDSLPGWYGYGYGSGFDNGYERSDPLLVKAVEVLGEEADGLCAKLKIVEVPDDVSWYIDDYDGMETVHESHNSWG